MELFDALPWLGWVLLGLGVLLVAGATLDLVFSFGRLGVGASLARYGALMPPGLFLLLAGLTAGSRWQVLWLGLMLAWSGLCRFAGRLALGWSRYRRPLMLFWRYAGEVVGPPTGHDEAVELPVGSNARLRLQLAEANAYLCGEDADRDGQRSPDDRAQTAGDGLMQQRVLYQRRWYFQGARAEDTAWVLMRVCHYRLAGQAPAATPAGFMALVDRIAMADFFQTSLLHGSPLLRVDALRFELVGGTPVISIELPELPEAPYHAHFMPLGRDGALSLDFTCRGASGVVAPAVLESFAREQSRRWHPDDPDAPLDASAWSGFRPALTDHGAEARIKLGEGELRRLLRAHCVSELDWVAFEHSPFYHQWMEQQYDQYERAFQAHQQAAIERFHADNLARIEGAGAPATREENA